MKITKDLLREIIEEEIAALREDEFDDMDDAFDKEKKAPKVKWVVLELVPSRRAGGDVWRGWAGERGEVAIYDTKEDAERAVEDEREAEMERLTGQDPTLAICPIDVSAPIFFGETKPRR